MGVTPVPHKRKVKKRTNQFKRYHSWRYNRVGTSWRKPHGIDGAFRRRFRGYPQHVKIGFGTDKQTRHILPNGFRKFLITKVSDLELLLMNNRSFCGEIARTLSSRKKAAIVKRA